MRVNVYAEEMTDRVEIIAKEIDGHSFTGLRFYLELPATVNGQKVSGPFIHRPGDDDSAAVTFWGKQDLRRMLRRALRMLDEHYGVPVAGVLEVGVDPATGEVIVNHPNLSPDDDGVGHIVFSQNQAIELAKSLVMKSHEAGAIARKQRRG
jgi:hypothetical protein